MDSHLVSRGQDRNYTGFLTKTIIYTASFVVFLGGASTIACLQLTTMATSYMATDISAN